MSCYKVRFDDYCLPHYDNFKYFNYFEFNGKKYPIGAHVNLTDEGSYYMLHDRGYGFKRGNFRLVDHYITDKGVEKWNYIIGRSYETNSPFLKYTTRSPDELIKEVLWEEIDESTFKPGELKVTFKEPNFFPKDWEVEGLMFAWVVFLIFWIGLFVLKDWWIRVIIQIVSGFWFGEWRNKKINEAIRTQKFKNK